MRAVARLSCRIGCISLPSRPGRRVKYPLLGGILLVWSGLATVPKGGTTWVVFPGGAI